MYFSQMPTIYYDFEINGVYQLKVLKDITVNVRFLKEVLSNYTMYDEYDIMDGETPELVATKIYGNPQYHWIIMLANDIYDYREDFPLEYTALDRKIKRIYGEANIYDTHHYENEKSQWVNEDYPLATPITNYTYEERINESKRRIKIISRSSIANVLSQYQKLFS